MKGKETQSKASANPTRWSLIVRAQGAGPEAAAALEELLGLYRGFLLFLIRVNRHPPDNTPEDLAQEFLSRIIRLNDIQKLERGRGSFRAWLRASVRYFLCNEWDRWHRRPKFDHAAYEEFHANTPEEAMCERAFLAVVLARAHALTREQTKDKSRFDRIQRFLPGPDADFDDVQGLAAELGIEANALSQFIFDTRRRFRRNVDATILETIEFVPDRDPDGPTGGAASLRLLEAEKCSLRRSIDGLPNGVIQAAR
jgi:DNA-directed RNA polymerase specialized sigma24 family protein